MYNITSFLSMTSSWLLAKHFWFLFWSHYKYLGDLCKMKPIWKWRSTPPIGKGTLGKKNHWFAEYLKLQITSGCHLVLSLHSKQVQLGNVSQTLFMWVLSISRNGGYAVSVIMVVPVFGHLCDDFLFLNLLAISRVAICLCFFLFCHCAPCLYPWVIIHVHL